MSVRMTRFRIPRKKYKDRNAYILQACTGKNVLHIGATDWPYTQERFNNLSAPLLYQEIDAVCESQIGIDIDEEGATFLNNHMNSTKSTIKIMDMNFLGELEYSPDVIVLGEVIEHLMNIETMLSQMKKVMGPNTKLIITTPNAYHFRSLCLNLFGYEVFHPDHKLIFTYGILKNILLYNGLVEEEFYFTKLNVSGAEKSRMSRLFSPVNELVSFFFPQFYNNLLFVCKRAD